MTWLLLLLLPVAVRSQPTPAPRLLWPLGRESVAYEVLRQVEAVNPWFEEQVDFAPNRPDMPYDAVQLRAQFPEDYVEVIVPESIPFPEFSISLLISFQSPRDYMVLLRYRAANSTDFHDAMVSYSMPYPGKPEHAFRVRLDDQAGGFETRFLLPQALVADTWYHVVLTWGGGNSVGVLLDGAALPMDTPNTNVPMSSLRRPGHLMLATTDAWLEAQYRALEPVTVSCLAMFDVLLDATSFEAGLDACKGSWQRPSPGGAETSTEAASAATEAATSSPPPPVHLFPLNDVSYGSDVMNTTATPTPGPAPCLRHAPPHPELLAPATLVDGSPLASLAARVHMRVFQGDYSVVLLVQPNVTSAGVLWEVSSSPSPPPAPPGLSRLSLSLSGPNLTFTVYDVTGQCGSVVAADVMSAMTWHVVTAARESSSGLLALSVDSGLFTAQDGCSPDGGVTGLADMRIGGALSRDENVRAVLQCLAVYDVTRISGVVAQAAVNACREAESAASPGEDGCDVTPTFRSLLLRGHSHHQAPDGAFGPMAVLRLPGVTTCAVTCAARPFCRSFVREAESCLLYDFSSAAAGLVPRQGASYYVIA